MRRLQLEGDVVGLLMPLHLLDEFRFCLEGLANGLAFHIPAALGGTGVDEIERAKNWLDYLWDHDGFITAPALARLAGLHYDTIWARIRETDGEVRENGFIKVYPDQAVRLIWKRLVLSPRPPDVKDNFWLIPLTRQALRILAMEWQSMLFSPPLRALGKRLTETLDASIRGDELAAEMHLQELKELKHLYKAWRRTPEAVCVVDRRRTLAATRFAAEDIVRLQWNLAVAEGRQ